MDWPAILFTLSMFFSLVWVFMFFDYTKRGDTYAAVVFICILTATSWGIYYHLTH